MTAIDRIKDQIRTIEEEIYESKLKINVLTKQLKEEYLKLGKVKGLAGYIISMGYPTELYSCWGTDSGEGDKFGDIRLKVVYNYGYTDVVGLTVEEFNQLEELIAKYHEEEED